jgi:hypothetical protein
MCSKGNTRRETTSGIQDDKYSHYHPLGFLLCRNSLYIMELIPLIKKQKSRVWFLFLHIYNKMSGSLEPDIFFNKSRLPR